MTNQSLNSKNLRFPSTPQAVQSDPHQVMNNAGGYVYKSNDKDIFRRFLILGTTGGTFYVSESKLTDEAVQMVQNYVNSYGTQAIKEAVDVSVNGLAPSNDQAIFVLALGLNSDDLDTKRAARDAVLKVVRTSTHLFTLCQFLKNIGGMGSSKRRALASWYTSKTDDQLAYQVTKYRQRNGWTHRDVMRISHVAGVNNDVGMFILNGEVSDTAPAIIKSYDKLSQVTTAREAVDVIRSVDTVAWEFLPTSMHKEAVVWRELIDGNHLPIMAMIRNLSRMGSCGVFTDAGIPEWYTRDSNSMNARQVIDKVVDTITNQKIIDASRIHPLDFLNAVSALGKKDSVYAHSYYLHSYGGVSPFELTSEDMPSKIISALEDGYKMAFDNITPIQGNALVGLDVSGSMHWIFDNKGKSNLSAAQAGAALIQVLYGAMNNVDVMAFSDSFVHLPITKNSSLSDILHSAYGLSMSPTDCSLPMQYALENKLDVDAFFVITDNETWSGSQHPMEALKEYRIKMNKPHARLFVIAMEYADCSIADPEDPYTCDIVGFDPSILKIIESTF